MALSTPITRGGILGPGSPVHPGRGLTPSVSSLGPAIERVWPPVTPTGVAGNSLGFMAALSRDPLAPLEVRCGNAYLLALDPEWTTPVAEIGVSFTGSAPIGSVYTMRPGDMIEVPDGFDRFWIHNADPFTPYAVPVNRGYCSFLVGRLPGARPVFATRQPNDIASLIGFIRSDQVGYLSVSGIQKLLFDAMPLTAAFAYNITSPWSARIKVFGTTRVLTAGAWGIASFDKETASGPKQVPNGGLDGTNAWYLSVVTSSNSEYSPARAVLDLGAHRPPSVQIGIDLIEDGGAGTVAAIMLAVRGQP